MIMDDLLNRLVEQWRAAEGSLLNFLDSVDGTLDAHTVQVRLIPREIKSRRSFVDWLNQHVADDGEWGYLTARTDSGMEVGFALPLTRARPADVAALPFVEIHTSLIAWWLVNAWRARQLAVAASHLAETDDLVAAAACARALIETAAAAWVDGRRLMGAWDGIKRAGSMQTDRESFAKRGQMVAILDEVMYGSKFDHRVPSEKEVWGRLQRSNVLGQIDKLAAAADTNLQADYQWLCNTVHPSIGNAFIFSAPPFLHETGTHIIMWFAGRSSEIRGADGRTTAERRVQTAIARGSTIALRALALTLDAALRGIDDLALTTGAAATARPSYWRKLTRPHRNDLCPCRSGLKGKRCRHEWGDPSPSIPTRLDDELSG
jgi:hypothetical protein